MLLALSGFMTQTADAETNHGTWTKGHEKVLVIPVRFTDAARSTNQDASGFTGWNALTNSAIPAEVNSIFLKQSYGRMSLEFTILPEISLGVATTYYTNNPPGTSGSKVTAWVAPGSLADDAPPTDPKRDFCLPTRPTWSS